MQAWLVEVLRWPPLNSAVGRGVVGGALILIGVIGAVIAVRLRDDVEE